MDSPNLFKVTYKPVENGDPGLHLTVYVVVPTWEDLVEYMHQCRGTIVSAESVNNEGERIPVLIAPEQYCSSLGK